MGQLSKKPQADITGDNSNSKPDCDRLTAQLTAQYLASNPAEKLRAWVQARNDTFTLSEAAQCLDMPIAASTRRAIRSRIGTILIKDIGCTRFRTRTPTTQFWYAPPQAGAKK